MGKKFNNINEELERIKTLMFETDEMVKNGTTAIYLNEQQEDFKTARSSFKLAKVSGLNTLIRGGASKFDTYKVKGTGVINLFDKDGKMTPEGIELMKKSGLKLSAGQIVMRIGKVDTSDTDKVFFQVVPTESLNIVSQSGDLKTIDPKELEQLKVVQDVTPKTVTGSTPSATTTGATPSVPTSLKPEDLVGKKLKDLNLNILDVTPQFNAYGYKSRTYYKLNKDTKDVYGVSKDDVIEAVFKRGTTAQKESFNMDLIFVNPLLFESVLNEADEIDMSQYTCIGDCKGQTKMSVDFTKLVDDSLAGKEITPRVKEKKQGDGGTKTTTSDWGNFPCITNNPVIKKGKMSNGSIVYQDEGNVYYSNGRFKDKKTGTMGNYRCDGDKIVSDKGSKTAAVKKATVVTDADLMGETGVLQNVLHSPWFISAVIPVLAALEFGTAGAATPLVAAAAGGSGVFASALDRTNRRHGMKGVVDALDGWVDEDDLLYTYMTIKSLDNKFYYDDSLEVPQYISATQAFMDLYQEDEGSDLISDVNSVGTKTLSVGSEKMKKRIINTINKQVAQTPPADLPTPSGGEGNA